LRFHIASPTFLLLLALGILICPSVVPGSSSCSRSSQGLFPPPLIGVVNVSSALCLYGIPPLTFLNSLVGVALILCVSQGSVRLWPRFKTNARFFVRTFRRFRHVPHSSAAAVCFYTCRRLSIQGCLRRNPFHFSPRLAVVKCTCFLPSNLEYRRLSDCWIRNAQYSSEEFPPLLARERQLSFLLSEHSASLPSRKVLLMEIHGSSTSFPTLVVPRNPPFFFFFPPLLKERFAHMFTLFQ